MIKKLFPWLLALAWLLTIPAAAGADTVRIYPQAGDIVQMGCWPQSHSGYDRTPIEWIVLDIDEENGRALLISRYLLEPVAYSDSLAPTTWETSDLRRWFNGTFLYTAFTSEEQVKILYTEVDNSPSQGCRTWQVDGGGNTVDKVFALSYAETRQYFGFTRRAQGILTDHASRGGKSHCLISDTEHPNGQRVGWWWMRSPGMNMTTAEAMTDDGPAVPYSITEERICARPAFWLQLSPSAYSPKAPQDSPD
ncbi:MAG: hypothetical protein IJ174_00725 [Clostridia bacterium]|nr:hypothetical protein [Clostridia bacterium]